MVKGCTNSALSSKLCRLLSLGCARKACTATRTCAQHTLLLTTLSMDCGAGNRANEMLGFYMTARLNVALALLQA